MFFPSLREETRWASRSILSWCEVADMDMPSVSLMSQTHISPVSRARRILTRVLSPKMLKKSASPSTISGLGMEDLALVTRSPCTSGTSQTSSLAGTPPGLDQDADEDYDDEDGHHRGYDAEGLDPIGEGGDEERHRDEDERQGDCCIHQRAFDHDP